MSDKRYFKNVSGKIYVLNDLRSIVIQKNASKEYLFTQEEIDNCRLLGQLIKNGQLVEVGEEQPELDPGEQQMGSPAKPKSGALSLAEALSGKKRSVVKTASNRTAQVREGPSKNDVPFSGLKKESNKELQAYWCGPAHDASGYGKMSRQCVEGLSKKGVDVELDLFKIPDFRCSVQISDALSSACQTKVNDSAPKVWAIMPPSFLPGKSKKILYTMMESKGLTKSFAARCNNADEIWVPSKFCMEVFSDAKLKPYLYHIPLGVDTDLYKKIEKPNRNLFGIETKSFCFISVFGWSLRKGCDVLFRSYLEEFTKDDDVTLILVSRKDGSSSEYKINDIRNDIKSYIKQYCPNPSRHPNIVHVGDAMSEDKLPHLYNMAHCFFLPSRGEGFGLPYAEAGACELPVIATRCCGQMDFLNDDNSYLADIGGYDIGSQQIRDLSSYYEGQPFAVLNKKTVDQLKDHMRDVVNNYSKAQSKGLLLRKNIVDNFQWKHTVDKIYDRLYS